MRIHIDFETRSEVDIWETGAWGYSTHPSTQIQCCAYAIGEGEVELLTKEDIYSRRMVALEVIAKDPEAIFIAHNAFFERSIWKNIMEPLGFPPIPVHRWRCTQAKACAYGLPKSLEKAADAFGLPQRKDKVGRQIMLRMCKPLPNKKGEIIYDEDPQNFKILYEYCRQDVRVERDLDNSLPNLSDIEQEIWFYDQLINTRGIRVDMPTVKKFIEILNNKTDALNKELVLLTNGAVTKGTQVQSMLAYLNAGGANMTSLTKQSVASAMKAGTLTKKQIQVLRLRQQLGKSSVAKYNKLVSATDRKGVLRDCFVYHGASTGRWSGKLVQLQNLPKGAEIDTDKAIDNINIHGYPAVEMMYPGKIAEVLSACIRGVFIPNEGNEMYVVDYGAIEARIVMWLAGEETGLKEFEATDKGIGEDIYVKMAQRIYGKPELTKQNNPKERQLGKQAILGCGFGMGASKFRATCEGYGIEVAEDEASRIVNLYRSTYYNVKNYWYDMEGCMFRAFETPGHITTIGNINWIYIKERNALFCQLPSGRILTYLEPKLMPNRFDQMGMTFMTEVNSQWVRRDTYGGLLVENCLTGDTKVVTMEGVKNITEVKKGDKVWDGENWVNTDGMIKRGIKSTGKLGGIRLTADHKIRVGNSWKSAIELDENSWQDALKLGQSLANFGYLKMPPATTAKLYVSVVAEQQWLSILDNYLEGLALAGNVAIKVEETPEGNIKTLCPPPCYLYGLTDIQGWSLGAIIKRAKRIKIMVGEALRSIKNGWKTASCFWNGQKLYQTGKPKGLTWNELITTGIIPQETYALSKEKLTAGTEETRNSSCIKARKYPIWISGRSTPPNGKVTTVSPITCVKEKPRKKLWQSTGVKEEVFDLLNCGALNRFAIISENGPVIVHNCTQAVARDIMAYSIPRLELAGFPTLMHTHDEIVSERPLGEGQISKMIKIMCEVPSWAIGCPIVAEGFVTQRYKKG